MTKANGTGCFLNSSGHIHTIHAVMMIMSATNIVVVLIWV